MSTRARLALVAVAALALASSALAAAPHVGGRAYLVVSARGDTLLQYRADQELPMASITKLMTVLVTLEHAKLDDVVTVGRQAAETGESSIDLRQGEHLTVRELIEGALIQSANDAAVALAQYVGHGNVQSFVRLMNAKARALGLTHTHFANPDGLDAPGHYASARDLTKLAEIAMHNAFVRSVVRQRTAQIPGRTLHTWNDLLGVFPGVFGVKTGHTDGARWGQVLAARGGGTTIYVTILGSPSRTQRNHDLERLLAYGLAQYRQVDAVSTGRSYASVALPYGRNPLHLVAREPLHAVVRVGVPLTERVVAPSTLTLPVSRGQVLGHVQVWDHGRLLGGRPLVASRSVARPGFVSRVGWYARRTVHHVADLLTP